MRNTKGEKTEDRRNREENKENSVTLQKVLAIIDNASTGKHIIFNEIPLICFVNFFPTFSWN